MGALVMKRLWPLTTYFLPSLIAVVFNVRVESSELAFGSVVAKHAILSPAIVGLKYLCLRLSDPYIKEFPPKIHWTSKMAAILLLM